MTQEEKVLKMTNQMAKFVGHIGKKLPDDVIAKLKELGDKETSPLAKTSMRPCIRIRSLR